MPDSIPGKQSWPSHRHPSRVGPKRSRRAGEPEGRESPLQDSPVHTPVPNPELPSRLSPGSGPLGKPSTSGPVSSPRRSHSSAQAPLPSNPVPSRPSRPHLPPSRPPPATSSHLLPPLSRPHLNGAGGLGDGPPPQPGCGSGGGGCVSASVSVPRGRQDLGTS